MVLRLREKRGEVNQMPCHHKLEAYPDAYIAAAGIREDKKGWLFRAAIGRSARLSKPPVSRTDVWYMSGCERMALNLRLRSGVIPSAPPASPTISPNGGSSKSRSVWRTFQCEDEWTL